MSEITIKAVTMAKLPVLQELASQTFRETFAFDNTEEQLQTFFDQAYTLPVLAMGLADPQTACYFALVDGNEAGFLKVNWGSAQTEQELDNAFEIQRIYVLQDFQGLGFGKALFDFALEMAEQKDFAWAWLGVWERNHKAQALYAKYGFEKFSEHLFPVGDKMDRDWLLKKALK